MMWRLGYAEERSLELATRLFEREEELIGNLRQLSRQDLPGVRQELISRGIDEQLVNRIIHR